MLAQKEYWYSGIFGQAHPHLIQLQEAQDPREESYSYPPLMTVILGLQHP